ncbi:MAG: hemolysin family protein [Phycisphaerales bacterium]
MSSSNLIAAPLLPALIACSAACSGAETALFSLTHADRLRLRKQSPDAADRVADLLESPRSLLVTLLLFNTSVNTAYFAVAVKVGSALGGPAAEAATGVVALLLLILFGELIPKSIAAVHRVMICRLLSGPMLVCYRLFWPVRIAAEGLVIGPLARLVRPAGAGESAAVSEEELGAMLRVGGQQGVLHKEEERQLADVLRLRSVRVREVMVPRVSMEWIGASATVEQALELSRQTRHLKFPVCRETIDEGVIGLVRLQRILSDLNRGKVNGKHAIAPYIEAPVFVPERARLDQLLNRMTESGSDVACCVDEHGSVTGLVSTEDVIRELVTHSGAADAAEASELRQVSEGVWEAPGRLSVRDWREFFSSAGSGAVDSRVSTIGGLILARLGRVPGPGESVQVGNLRLKVLKLDGRSVELVEIAIVDRGVRL